MPETKDLLNPIAAPENAVIGDENLSPRDPDVSQVNEDVPAQVTGAPAKPVETVKVTETVVALDEFVTRKDDPLGVQIPDAGRGPLNLPIHRLAEAGTPEQQFAEADKDSE